MRQTQLAIVNENTYAAASVETYLYSTATDVFVTWTFPGLIMTNLQRGDMLVMVHIYINEGFPRANDSLGLPLNFPFLIPSPVILRIVPLKNYGI